MSNFELYTGNITVEELASMSFEEMDKIANAPTDQFTWHRDRPYSREHQSIKMKEWWAKKKAAEKAAWKEKYPDGSN